MPFCCPTDSKTTWPMTSFMSLLLTSVSLVVVDLTKWELNCCSCCCQEQYLWCLLCLLCQSLSQVFTSSSSFSLMLSRYDIISFSVSGKKRIMIWKRWQAFWWWSMKALNSWLFSVVSIIGGHSDDSVDTRIQVHSLVKSFFSRKRLLFDCLESTSQFTVSSTLFHLLYLYCYCLCWFLILFSWRGDMNPFEFHTTSQSTVIIIVISRRINRIFFSFFFYHRQDVSTYFLRLRMRFPFFCHFLPESGQEWEKCIKKTILHPKWDMRNEGAAN